MSFIRQRIRCKQCSYEINVALGTFGFGLPEKCSNCGKRLDCEVVSSGWNAKNDSQSI